MLAKLKNTQNELALIFEKSIKENTFSHSTLFCGNEFTSKMTAAIEVAKALSCKKESQENCDCDSCKAYDKCLMQNLVIVSNRDNESRIEVAIQYYLKKRDAFSKKFLIDTIRIFLLSYHNALYVDKNKKLFESAYQVSEIINEFDKNNEVLKIREAQRFLKDLKTKLKPLFAVDKKNQTNLSVDGVRALQTWLNNTLVSEKARIVVIESIEKTNESVKNSLLKILEEPNKNVYFILISKNPSRIMKTILSRVRKYNFLQIKQEKQQNVLQKFNLEDKSVDTFEKFYLSTSGLKIEEIDKALNQIMNSINSKRYLNSEALSILINTLDTSNNVDYILNQLILKIEDSYNRDIIDAFVAKNMINDISGMYNNQRVFNLVKKNMYENIYRKMMERVNA